MPRKNVNIEIGRGGPVRPLMRSCRWVFFSLAPDPDIMYKGTLPRGPDGKVGMTYRINRQRCTPPKLCCRSDGSWKIKLHEKPAIASDTMYKGTLPLGPMCKLRTTSLLTTGALLPPCCRSDGSWKMRIHEKPAIDYNIMYEGTLPLVPMCKIRITSRTLFLCRTPPA